MSSIDGSTYASFILLKCMITLLLYCIVLYCIVLYCNPVHSRITCTPTQPSCAEWGIKLPFHIRSADRQLQVFVSKCRLKLLPDDKRNSVLIIQSIVYYEQVRNSY